jgi:hypothetical protein
MTAQRSEKQTKASRENGALSKGPTSAEGRARSARNAVKHGFTSKKFFPGEDSQAYANELVRWQSDYRPATAAAVILAEECARASTNLRRIARWHDAMIDFQITDFLKRKQEGDDRVLQALWDLLDKEPIVALNKMLETSDGCRWMADAWDVIAERLEKDQPLDPFLNDLGVRLLGGFLHGPRVWEFDLLCELHAAKDRRAKFASYMALKEVPPSLRKKYPELPFRDVWMSRLKAIVEEKRSVLRRREAALRDRVEPALMARILPTYLGLADDRDSTKYHRYHRDAFSTLLRGIKALKDCVHGEAVATAPPEPEPEEEEDLDLPEDVDVHAGFDESEDAGPVDVPGYKDPLSRNEPGNRATAYREEVYPELPAGMIREANGYFVAADGSRIAPHSTPGLWLEKCWAQHGR